MIELKGSLRGVGLLPIVQLLADVQETGQLCVSRGVLNGQLAFEAGRLVGVVLGDERGLPALAALALAFPEADFEYLKGPAPTERNVDLTVDQLRAHLSRMGGSLEMGNAVPSLRAVPRLVESAGAYNQRLELERGSLQLLLGVNGARNVAEIIGDRPLVPALRELSELVNLGLIRMDAAAPAPPPAAGHASEAVELAAASVRAAPAQPAAREASPARQVSQEALASACPKLGFADDPGRRYSRPTGLHRCYASEAPTLVTPREQRELCLSGAYGTCPRLDGLTNGVSNAPPVNGTGSPPHANGMGHAAAAVLTPPAPRPQAPRAEALRAESARPATPRPESAQPAQPRPAIRRPAVHLTQRAAHDWLPRLRSARVLLAGGIGLSLLIAVAAVGVLLVRPKLVSSPSAAPPAAAPRLAPPPNTQLVPTPVPQIVPRPTAVAPTAAAAQPTVIPPGPAQSPVAQASMPGGHVLLDLRFTERPTGWLDNPPFAHWADGAYRLLAKDTGHFVAVAAPLAPQSGQNANLIVSATMRKVSGPAGGGYGVIVRDQASDQRDGVDQSGDFYVLEVGDRGEVGVWRRTGDTWIDILPWTATTAVRPGGSPNDLVVQAVAKRLVFQVNNVEVLNARMDSSLDGGGVGLFVGGDSNEVALDHFSVQTPD